MHLGYTLTNSLSILVIQFHYDVLIVLTVSLIGSVSVGK